MFLDGTAFVMFKKGVNEMAYMVKVGYFGEEEERMDYPKPTMTNIGICLNMNDAIDYIRQIPLDDGFRDYTNDEIQDDKYLCYGDHEIRYGYRVLQPIRCTAKLKIYGDGEIFHQCYYKYYYIEEIPLLRKEA